MKMLRKLFCIHKWEIREWRPLDKDGRKLFGDVGLLNTCERCDKKIKASYFDDFGLEMIKTHQKMFAKRTQGENNDA